jgi:hypothetical protein
MIIFKTRPGHQEIAAANRSMRAASKCSSHSAPDRPLPTSAALYQERKDLQRPRRHWLRIRRLPVRCRFGVETHDAGRGPYHYASGNHTTGDAKVSTHS